MNFNLTSFNEIKTIEEGIQLCHDSIATPELYFFFGTGILLMLILDMIIFDSIEGRTKSFISWVIFVAISIGFLTFIVLSPLIINEWLNWITKFWS